MSYSSTPNLALRKPIVGADADAWGGDWNWNADTLDSTIHGLGAGPFLPLSGGTMSGPLTLTPGNNLTVGSATITGFGAGIGQALGPFVNFQGSGLPAIQVPSRLIFDKLNPAPTDYTTMQINRTTSFTSATQNLVHALAVLTNVGAGDNTENWNLLAQCATASTGPNAAAVGAFLQGIRSAGTSQTWGSISDAIDSTGLPSISNQGLLGSEVDVECNKLDTGANALSVQGTGNRKGIQLVAARYDASDNTPVEVSNGIWFSTNKSSPPAAYVYYDSLIGAAAGTMARQALDTRGLLVPSGSTRPFYSVVMPASHAIEFNAGSNWDVVGTNYLQYNTSGTPRLTYMVGASEVSSISDAGVVTTHGVVCSDALAANPEDLSHQLQIYSTVGISLTSGRLNYTAGGGTMHVFRINSADRLQITTTGMGFNGNGAIAKPTIAGACAGNTAIKALLTALASYGLVQDSTSA